MAKRSVNRLLTDGASLREVAKQLDIALATVQRHKARHWDTQKKVLAQLAARDAAEGVAPEAPLPVMQPLNIKGMSPEDVVEAAVQLLNKANEIFEAARVTGSVKEALFGVETVRKSLELIAKLNGQLGRAATVNIDQRTVNVVAKLDALSIDELRALARGDTAARILSASSEPIDG